MGANLLVHLDANDFFLGVESDVGELHARPLELHWKETECGLVVRARDAHQHMPTCPKSKVRRFVSLHDTSDRDLSTLLGQLGVLWVRQIEWICFHKQP